jgi:glycosyltransferase involved in cell wall biosynthesis
MKILLDNIIFNLQAHGGISVYWRELTRRLSLDRQNSIESVEEGKKIPTFVKRFLPQLTTHSKAGPFIFHSSYYRICLARSAQNIVTVHDFTHRRLGGGLKNFLFIIQQSLAILKAARIICVSESTKSDLIKFFPKVDPGKIDVIYNGISEIYLSQAALRGPYSPAGRKYVLFVGSRATYKNFYKVVAAVGRTDLNLVVAGSEQLSNAEKSELDQLLPSRWSFAHRPSDEALVKLYSEALCLLYPSSYEGFGIPVLEAAACGVPAIVCRISSLPEVAGPSTFLINRPDVAQIYDALNQIQRGLWQADSDGGREHALKFTWDNCYQKTMGCYLKALS